MITKVLIYVNYNDLEYESDFNAWIQTEDGGVLELCWNPDKIGEFIDVICSHVSEECGTKKVDLQIVKDKAADYTDFSKEFNNRKVQLIKRIESAWTKAEIKEIIKKNFNKEFQYGTTEDGDSTKNISDSDNSNRKASLSKLMIQLPKEERFYE